jgi:hypothetical protein
MAGGFARLGSASHHQASNDSTQNNYAQSNHAVRSSENHNEHT